MLSNCFESDDIGGIISMIMKKLGALLVIAILAFAIIPLAACSKSKMISVYAVSFYENSVSVEVGGTVKLEYKVFPTNATHKEVEFKTSDPSSAVVS